MKYEEGFKQVLGNRTNIESTIKNTISKYETDKIGFFVVEYLGYDEETEEEIPGYQIFLMGKTAKLKIISTIC